MRKPIVADLAIIVGNFKRCLAASNRHVDGLKRIVSRLKTIVSGLETIVSGLKTIVFERHLRIC